MRRIMYWILLQAKRLYKKASFIILLALVPASVLALGIAAGEDSGIVRIALARTTENDPVSCTVMDELMNDTTIIGFTQYDTPSDAIEAVRSGEVDEAWIFVADATLRMQEYASTASSGEPFVTMIGREDNFLLSLMREKLSATVFKHCAGAFYIDFLRENAPRLDELSDAELMEYFDSVTIGEDLFKFGNLDEADTAQNTGASYVTAPVRGLLGILCVVCGLAASMYYIDDDYRGAYSKIPESRRLLVAYASIAVAVFNVSVVSFVSMQFAGVGIALPRELAIAFANTLAVSAFCLLVMSVFRDNRMIGSLILPIAVVMIGVCPVFFDFRGFGVLQLLLPPTYYVNSSYNTAYMLYAVLYSVLCLVATFVLDTVKGFIRKMR